MEFKKLSAAALALMLGFGAYGQTDAVTLDEKEVEIKPLTIGDKAPAFSIEHWVKGDPVTEYEDGKIYVMEFWATWCGPCRASMPHISELQKKYADYDVTFIGVSDEDLETVTEFMAKTSKKDEMKWNEVVQYTLATDPDESVKTDYFTAAGRRGIPSAFIIGKDQRVEWIGHPMEIDPVIEAVVKDSWNRNEFKTKWEKEQAAELALAKDRMKLNAAIESGDYDKALAILDKQIATTENPTQILFAKFNLMLTKMNMPDRAYAVGNEIVTAEWDNPMMLNQIAWFVVDDSSVEKRNFDFAMKAAQRANELTDEKDAAILDTLARVYYETGDLETAIQNQRKAVKNATGNYEAMAEDLKEALERYEEELEDRN